MSTDVEWRSYEEVARYLLNQFADSFGLEAVEGKQKIYGQLTTTEWEIDARGTRCGGEAFVIIECRRYASKRQSQAQAAELAFKILDTNADGAILVSHLGLQTGAEKVAHATNILSVTLDKNSTALEFSMRFLNKLFIGIHEQCNAMSSQDATVTRICELCKMSFPKIRDDQRLCLPCDGAERSLAQPL